MFRKKIIDALLENALYALFDYFNECPDEAAIETLDCAKSATKILYPSDSGGNGTVEGIRKRWLSRYHQSIRERLGNE